MIIAGIDVGAVATKAVIANYGYSDGSGDYYIILDSEGQALGRTQN